MRMECLADKTKNRFEIKKKQQQQQQKIQKIFDSCLMFYRDY